MVEGGAEARPARAEPVRQRRRFRSTGHGSAAAIASTWRLSPCRSLSSAQTPGVTPAPPGRGAPERRRRRALPGRPSDHRDAARRGSSVSAPWHGGEAIAAAGTEGPATAPRPEAPSGRDHAPRLPGWAVEDCTARRAARRAGRPPALRRGGPAGNLHRLSRRSRARPAGPGRVPPASVWPGLRASRRQVSPKRTRICRAGSILYFLVKQSRGLPAYSEVW